MSIDYMHRPAALPQLLANAVITNLMHIVYLQRPGLQEQFDLTTAAGQVEFVDWFRRSSLRYYGILPFIPVPGQPQVGPKSIPFARFLESIASPVRRLSRPLPLGFRRLARSLWLALIAAFAGAVNRLRVPSHTEPEADTPEPGANLIGYAFGELGMGEHVRMTAVALAGQSLPFGVVNFTRGLGDRQTANFQSSALISRNRYSINLFHINADQMLDAYCELGAGFFEKRYNIGYWAWELSKCPDAWFPILGLVDEIWAPSTFIRDCFQAATDKPVVLMPLCVELPDFPLMPRVEFGLQEDTYCFFTMFDFLSYIERKNPFGAIAAFRIAFPEGSERVRLVVKVMNGEKGNSRWREMIEQVRGDPRIVLIDETFDRHRLLALMDSCDSLVSLHRSEGFGRGPAEAMYLGKPVIVTNYSGNVDFAGPHTSLLVDYKLVQVGASDYPFSVGQVWAEPNIAQAAAHMRALFLEPAMGRAIGMQGQKFIRENFNSQVIGMRVADRLTELLKIQEKAPYERV